MIKDKAQEKEKKWLSGGVSGGRKKSGIIVGT